MATQEQFATPPLQPASNYKQRAVWERRLWTGLILTILIIGAVIMSMPFVWLVSNSFQPLEKIFIFPPEWIPNPFRPEDYTEAPLYKAFCLYLLNTMRNVATHLVGIMPATSFRG